MARLTLEQKSRKFPEMRRLLEESIKVMEGNDMDYYACSGCHQTHTHKPDCICMRIYKILQETK